MLLRCAPLDGADANWLAKLSPGAAVVYPDAARVWLGAALLLGRDDAPLDAAHDAKRLVEEVYLPNDALRPRLPPTLAEALDAPEGQRFATRGRARDEGMGFERGLLRDWNDGGALADVEGATRLSSGARLVLAVRDANGVSFLRGSVSPKGTADPIEEATVPTPYRVDADAQRGLLGKGELEALTDRSASALGITPAKALLRLKTRVIVVLNRDREDVPAGGTLLERPVRMGEPHKPRDMPILYDATYGLRRGRNS